MGRSRGAVEERALSSSSESLSSESELRGREAFRGEEALLNRAISRENDKSNGPQDKLKKRKDRANQSTKRNYPLAGACLRFFAAAAGALS